MNRMKTFGPVVIVAAVLLLTGVWATVAVADAIPPRINMNIGMEPIEPGIIKTVVRDDSDIAKVLLFYRTKGEAYFNSIVMEHRNDVYYKELNRELGLDGIVEYYILAQDTSGNEVTQPRLDPEENPMTASASEYVNQSELEIQLSNPEAGTVLETGDEPIMITFYTAERELDFNTFRFRVDKRDRTREAEIFGNVMVWEPRRPLTDGYHEIEAVIRDTNGDYVGPNIWTFKVSSQRELPLGAEGDFYLGLQRDERSGDDHGVPLWNNKVDMALKGVTGAVNWNAGIMLSSEESSFLTSETIPDRQPINRFYLDARTRNLRLRFGDSNPNFSELTLKGILVRGLNLQFNSSRFSSQFVYGYNKRSLDEQVQIIDANVTPNPLDQSSYTDENGEQKSLSSYQMITQDPVTGKFHVYEFTPGTFKRDVMAFKVDVTPVKMRSATWKVGLNIFSAEDDSTSLDYNYDPTQESRVYGMNFGTVDTTFTTDYKPQKNWVGTIGTSLRFNNNRSELAAEFGGTMVTENMFGNLTDDLRDELPEGIDDELFRFNASTQTSFDKQKLADNIAAGAADAIKSVYKVRFTSPIPIPKVSTNLKSEFYRIPTHYVSLGNPQQKTDVGGYKLNIRSRFLRDQVTLNLGYDAYADNLDSEQTQYAALDIDGNATGQQDLTKDTTVSSVSVNVRPRLFAEYAPTFTVGYRAYTAENDLDLSYYTSSIDKLSATMEMVNTATSTFMVSFGGTLPVGYQKHTGTLSITNMSIADDRPLPDYSLNESNNLSVMFNVNSSVNPLPLTLTGSVGYTGNSAYRPLYDAALSPIGRSEITTGITMLNVSGTYKWFRDKRLATSAGLGVLGSSNGEAGMYEIDNNKFSLKFEIDYKLNSVTTLGGQLRFISYTDNANSVNDYSEPILGATVRAGF